LPVGSQCQVCRHSGGRASSYRRILGAAALFSGAALVAHILSGISLRLTLAFTALLLIAAVVSVLYRAKRERRTKIRRLATAGVLAGLVATAAYDATKFVLSRGTTSAYNPFEVIRAFGLLLAGPSSPGVSVAAAFAAIPVSTATWRGFGRRNVARCW
jgi:hypothetical protein